jgi:hypothetical protein
MKWFKTISLWSVGCIWFVGCANNVEDRLDPTGAFEDVRTITTRFESNQDDTRKKDDKVVAVAYFLPDGAMDKVVQHMTYPYDYAHSFDRTFWAAPIKANLSHAMDGLDLGDAEKNLLYGNDWPVVFEQFVKENGHPNGMRFEGFKSTTEVKYQDNLPIEIETVPDGAIPFGAGYIDQFTYEKGKVSSNVSYLNSRLRLKVSEGKIVTDGVEELVQVNKKNVLFEYDADKLVKVDQGDQVFRFFFEGDQLVRSEFSLRGKLYNTRKYSYSDSGLKSKTEVYNVFGDLEYTISYEYTFYE